MKRIIYLLQFLLLLATNSQAGELDRYLSSKGMVDVSRVDTSIHILLKYATTDNLFNKAVYSGITGIWLHPDAAAKLQKAQRILKSKYPAYSLIVYDAARPMSVQRKMWDMVKGTSKTNYVSNPAKGGGLHNYGMAVDVTIVDKSGTPLQMGSPYDHFGEEAHINNEEALVKSGKITQQAFNNRRLLRQVMREAGFRTILYEWWHFNACSREEARKNYSLID
ncbi:D-alanyl-D-alanine dipeptidase [Parabacteroides sp. PF5-5]|uniref:M15 family metallopeptidase n=1 Tax=unclassified Parabacteroides TaxID=2649774 RepID=UPI0024764023|nr:MULTISPECIES: M15 family metallopeptidase [unclassified Parabacteroides]MDH6306093.1 D-alanyl-D-alanine dipeptidase [Parabacteroides sp. PH5-39]MDH6317009.1 D-alanyl-D-alanine dipeptidase [Parabacteroides sp. PF5-13]MDH6320762.1 D-alanyl-D-alanine dipeptidase [Parabacteroides sp. PH5-13]MDH6324536.1 D-alanyl-D-alanine dipeptidase [Parabacteroides sp. PH5-8]MDH6328194.1 D-alanyl-D-alanine dipeptidase [Parabacteroides sp. PH5-41]